MLLKQHPFTIIVFYTEKRKEPSYPTVIMQVVALSSFVGEIYTCIRESRLRTHIIL